jgi:hypothetical protein
MIDPNTSRWAPPSQFPAWLADDLGLDPSTIDATIRRPTTWDRVRQFVRRSRHHHSEALVKPSPIASHRPSDPSADNESAAA